MSVTEKTMQYNISSVDASIKFGSLATGTYYFVVKATDASGTRTLVNNKFTVVTDPVAALKARALGNWVAPVKNTGFYSVTSGGRYFGASRDSGARAHAGIDIHYSNGAGIAVYAMESGKVIEYISNFYGGTSAIAVQHAGGSVARYCEISTSLRKGDTVTKGQQIAKITKNNQGGDTMLHLELYLGTETGSLTNTSNTTYDYVTKRVYFRRATCLAPRFLLDLI
jgi:murein DD-endopeptidase MepM/ murein hydrolase activator NlpD